MKKILFYNISGAIHGNNISEILISFEYFRNMYPCHRRFRDNLLDIIKGVILRLIALKKEG